MNFNRQKFYIAFACALVGWVVGFQMGKKYTEKELVKQQSARGVFKLFDLPFSGLFHESNSEGLDDPNLQDNLFSLFGHQTSQPQIKTSEDDHMIFMELDLENFDKNSLSARVEGQMVIIEGNQKAEELGGAVSSHFYQSFSVPQGTDPSKVDIVYENNKLILKFPKLNR